MSDAPRETDPTTDDVLEPEYDEGLRHDRHEHGGMPLRPDDDELERAVERDRVAAGLADFVEDDVPAATDPEPGADEDAERA